LRRPQRWIYLDCETYVYEVRTLSCPPIHVLISWQDCQTNQHGFVQEFGSVFIHLPAF
jgi:hypothetical protein